MLVHYRDVSEIKLSTREQRVSKMCTASFGDKRYAQKIWFISECDSVFLPNVPKRIVSYYEMRIRVFNIACKIVLVQAVESGKEPKVELYKRIYNDAP